MANVQKESFLSPVGRMVQGDPFTPQTTDQNGQPLLVKSGPNMGKQTQKYFCAIAIAKNDPALPAFWAQLVGVAKRDWPQLHDAATGEMRHPNFSWKMSDGDGVDQNGQPNNTKEGWAGCYVFKFSSSYKPRVFYKDHYQPQEEVQDKNLLRRGHYIRVNGTVEGNGNQQRPGLYLNLNLVEIVAGGIEITSGPDAAAIFGNTPVAALPAGAIPIGMTAAPAGLPGMTAATPMMPGAVALNPHAPVPMGAVAMPGAAPAMAAMPGLPTAAAPVPTVPHAGFVQAMPGMGAAPSPVPLMPQAAIPVAPAAVPAAPAFRMTGTAGPHTREAMNAGGWTDEALLTAGHMVRV